MRYCVSLLLAMTPNRAPINDPHAPIKAVTTTSLIEITSLVMPKKHTFEMRLVNKLLTSHLHQGFSAFYGRSHHGHFRILVACFLFFSKSFADVLKK